MAERGKETRAGTIAVVIGLALAIGGLGLLLTPLTERDSTGYSLHCGTAVNPDEDAARRYHRDQVGRVLEETLDGMLGAPTTSDLGRRIGGAPAERAGHDPTTDLEELDRDCANSLSTMRKWSVGFVILGVLVALAGLMFRFPKLVDLARSSTAGARLPTWMRTCPEWVQAGLVTAAGLTGGFSGITTGGWRVFWVIMSVFIACFAVLLSFARSAENSRRNRQLSDLRADHRAETQHLVGNELHSLIQVTAEAVATEDHTERCAAARAARTGLLSAAAHLVGTMGARANLFQLSDDRSKMTLAPGGFAGRGTRSRREFSAGDKTFDLTMVEQGRFVESAKDELVGAEREVPYQTFMTYPVSIGRDHIHGVLTVDSLTTGDFDQVRDMPIMAVLSALIAITFECEKYGNTRL